jgi:hypothetical protein
MVPIANSLVPFDPPDPAPSQPAHPPVRPSPPIRARSRDYSTGLFTFEIAKKQDIPQKIAENSHNEPIHRRRDGEDPAPRGADSTPEMRGWASGLS